MQQRAKATRRSLLETAAHLFAERGYAGTSINDISRRSGRTSGAVYFHYASKERLALAVVEDAFATWPHLTTRYTDCSVPPLDRLVALSFEIAHALMKDTVVRAGARLWAERDAIDASLPDPFALWTTATTRLLAQARTTRQLAQQARPAAVAPTLVRAFYGLCTLTEALEGRHGIADRLTDWWHITLPFLQHDTDATSVLGRVRAAGSGGLPWADVSGLGTPGPAGRCRPTRPSSPCGRPR
ncbi:ScbR family autoregulator-binding transcription factor [Streptomyces lichenis]|uniref:TetR/AcrR family transcriptional regulator n=1 Tax=Streptomyces lichenis TaxID=2306967 RepID=A0ABT0IB31_9ACTN|nr:ScbR family autoregulator-binding transcription factor [Streptomyces lichenis]MCK8678519.1 TetR/AcrR family transcriptional regulator [Streptomyces lichenis]